MNYKVGDIVKIKNDFSCSKKYEIGTNKKMEKYAGKTMTIREINGNAYRMEEDNGEYYGNGWRWSEDMLKGKVDFTKSDLKDGDVVTYKNGDKRTKISNRLLNEDGNTTNWLHSYNEDLTRECEERKETDIIKVERPTGYETVYERKEEILDEAEKRYLRGVIKPFRDRVQNITKWRLTQIDTYFIKIRLKNGEILSFPKFTSKTMYEGMQEDKAYAIEELGL